MHIRLVNVLKHFPVTGCKTDMFACSPTGLAHASLHTPTHAQAGCAGTTPESNFDDLLGKENLKEYIDAFASRPEDGQSFTFLLMLPL